MDQPFIAHGLKKGPPKRPTFASSVGISLAYTLLSIAAGSAVVWLWHHWEVAAWGALVLLVGALIHFERVESFERGGKSGIEWPKPHPGNIKPDGYY
jgi:hypothetical protein